MSKSPFIDKTELHNEIVPWSASTTDRQEARGLFPKRRTLAPGSRRVFWLRSEIESWLKAQGVGLASAHEAEAVIAVKIERVAPVVSPTSFRSA